MEHCLTVKLKYSSDEELKQIFMKLYAGQLMTSNQVMQVLRMDRESFLSEVNRHQIAVHCVDTGEVISEMQRENDKAISKVREIVSRARMLSQGRTPHFWRRPDMINMIQQIIEAV